MQRIQRAFTKTVRQGGSVDELLSLLEQRASVNAPATMFDECPLMIATAGNHLEIVRFLLENNADVDPQGLESTARPLQRAALRGYEAIVRELVAHGAEVNWVSVYGTALHASATSGNAALVEYLLDLVGEVNAHSPGPNQHTPLHCVVAGGHLEVARVLLRRGAWAHSHGQFGFSPIHHAAAISDQGLCPPRYHAVAL